MTILAIDFMNIAHRARSGFSEGDYNVVYNFFRQVKSLVDQFEPNRVFFALEGRPVRRHEALTEYKANRKVEAGDPKYDELMKFFKQKDIILDLLTTRFPVSVVRHPTYEADDTIANIAKISSTAVPWIIVSSDTDFIQLLQERDNISLYNPVKKEFVSPPSEYDYVTWKALRGDGSDNIPGIPGVGDKTAAKIASNPQKLSEYIQRPDVKEVFARNYNLIKFPEWTDEERSKMTSSAPQKNWNEVMACFSNMSFNSIVKPGSWEKFTSSFDSLWGG